MAAMEPDRGRLPIRAPACPPCVGHDASTAVAPERFNVRAPHGAPNVLVVMLDDMGFGAADCFGGPIHMPAAARLAREGLRYTAFHTTALCAPTRTALLSGYNHHTNNMGTISEMGTAFPGNTSVRPKTVTPLARVLRENGYCTAQIGKCHETPTWEVSPMGPFTHWPTFSGFDKFYGFMGGSTDQYHPQLYDGVTQLPTPQQPGYHLSADLADRSIEWLRLQRALDSDKPFFLYLAPGATHSPHQVPAAYADRYRGWFDEGWDALRQKTLANMKALGIAPPEAVLAPKPPDVPDWESLPTEERRVLARQMEVYAGFAEHVDEQVGRVLAALEEMGALDDTLVFYLLGDNGASAEGLMSGLYNEHCTMNGVPEPFAVWQAGLGKLGGEESWNHYSVGWAIAMDAPFTWAKQVASNYGGTRNGMVVRYPKGISSPGGLRAQFHHCVDITPTILEVAGIPAPSEVDGIAQRPMEGTSLAYTFNAPGAPPRRTTQYFCVGANYGIYHQGWFAGVVSKVPWEKIPRYASYKEGVWELYHVEKDYSMAHDLAKEQPEKLRELQAVFEREAAAYNVFPIDSRGHLLFDAAYAGRPDFSTRCTEMTLGYSATGLPESCFPNLKNSSYTITADVEVGGGACDGVLLAQGGRFGGLCLYIKQGRPCFAYNYFAQSVTTIRAEKPLKAGKNQVQLDFRYDGGGKGMGGVFTLRVNGMDKAKGRVAHTVPLLTSFTETTCVGMDRGTPVCDDYSISGSRFAGQIFGVHVKVGD